MPNHPQKIGREKEKEMLFRMQAAGKHIAYSACFALLPSSVFSSASEEVVLI